MGKITQILSDESLNDHNMIVLSDGIDWSRFVKNPVLLENHDWKSQPIGNVINIHRDGDNWVGELKFAEGTERGKTAKYLYENGFYRAVSLGGFSKEYVDESSGITYATNFIVYEISLLSLQSNKNAVSDFSGEKVMLKTEFHRNESSKITTLGAMDISLINKYKEKMDGKEKINLESADQQPELQNESEADHKTEEKKHENVELKTEETKLESEISEEKVESVISRIFRRILGTEEHKEEDKEIQESSKSEKTTLNASESEKTEKDEPTQLGAEGSARLFDPQKINLNTSVEAPKTLHQFMASPEGAIKFGHAIQLLSVRAEEVSNPVNAVKLESAREFINVISSDRGFMTFMGNINVHTKEGGRYEKLSSIVDRVKTTLASGANSATFVTTTPDLAVVEWLSLFFRQLLPDNSWANRCGRISGSDKEGVIWIESAMKPKIYYGDRAPVNVADYLYDDDPIGLITKVFSLQPILWQSANSDILAYNDQSWGQNEAMRIMVDRIHSYALQKIAEAAGAKIAMSGITNGGEAKSFSAVNAFPINSAATGNLYQLSPNDLTAAQTQFINWNYTMDVGEADLVMDAVYMQHLQTNPLLASLLTKNAGALRPMYGEYSGFVFRPRSTTAAYDTASSKVVDAELYCDGKVSADGTIPSYTPPVLAATAYGLGLGFIPSEVILAMGNVNVHMVADPNSYGWKFSVDMRFGAGAARKGGKGILLFTPTVVTTSGGGGGD